MKIIYLVIAGLSSFFIFSPDVPRALFSIISNQQDIYEAVDISKGAEQNTALLESKRGSSTVRAKRIKFSLKEKPPNQSFYTMGVGKLKNMFADHMVGNVWGEEPKEHKIPQIGNNKKEVNPIKKKLKEMSRIMFGGSAQ